MDFRPYIVASVYMVGMIILFSSAAPIGWIITFIVVGGFFSLLFGLLHRIESSTLESISRAPEVTINSSSTLTEEEIARVVSKTLKETNFYNR